MEAAGFSVPLVGKGAGTPRKPRKESYKEHVPDHKNMRSMLNTTIGLIDLSGNLKRLPTNCPFRGRMCLWGEFVAEVTLYSYAKTKGVRYDGNERKHPSKVKRGRFSKLKKNILNQVGQPSHDATEGTEAMATTLHRRGTRSYTKDAANFSQPLDTSQSKRMEQFAVIAQMQREKVEARVLAALTLEKKNRILAEELEGLALNFQKEAEKWYSELNCHNNVVSAVITFWQARVEHGPEVDLDRIGLLLDMVKCYADQYFKKEKDQAFTRASMFDADYKSFLESFLTEETPAERFLVLFPSYDPVITSLIKYIPEKKEYTWCVGYQIEGDVYFEDDADNIEDLLPSC